MVIVDVALVCFHGRECLVLVVWATKDHSMGVFVLNPVLPAVVELVRVSAIFVGAHVWAEIMD